MPVCSSLSSIVSLGYTGLLKTAAQPPALSPSLHLPPLSKLTGLPTPHPQEGVPCRVFTLWPVMGAQSLPSPSRAQLTVKSPLHFSCLCLGLEQPACDLWWSASNALAALHPLPGL